MIERKYVVQKVVELMDQIGDMQMSLTSENYQQVEQGILAKALIVDHLMWVLELNDPKLPGAALVREEWAAIQAAQETP